MNERVEPTALLRETVPVAPTLPPDHPVVACGRVGVLLMNLGTPEGTSYWPMRRYLKARAEGQAGSGRAAAPPDRPAQALAAE